MVPLIVLVVVTLLARLIGQLGVAHVRDWAAATRVGLAVMLCFTAAAHFNSMRPDMVAMVPPFVPNPEFMVTFTGICEILGAIGLLVPRTRRLAALALIVFLLAVLPANIHAAQAGVTLRGAPATPIVPRVALQALFIGLLWWSGVRSSNGNSDAARGTTKRRASTDNGVEPANSTTRVTRHIKAPRSEVYRALLDPRAVAAWMVPDGMTSQVHAFDAREGGAFRISLTYDEPTGTGKTMAHTDTYHGHFVRLAPGAQVVQIMEFETAEAAMRGEMTVTYTLTDADGGTDVLAVHERVPPGVAPADNETGWRMSLDKLAALLEQGQAEAAG